MTGNRGRRSAGDGPGGEDVSGFVGFGQLWRSGVLRRVGRDGQRDLWGDGAVGNRFLERMPRQVADQAVPRAFAIGQEHRQDGSLSPCGFGFRFPKPMRRPPRIQSRSAGDAGPPRQDPGLPFGPALRIRFWVRVQLRSMRTSGRSQEKRFLGAVLRFRYPPARSVAVGPAAWSRHRVGTYPATFRPGRFCREVVAHALHATEIHPYPGRVKNCLPG